MMLNLLLGLVLLCDLDVWPLAHLDPPDPSGDPWSLVPFHYRAGARPRWTDDAAAAPDREAQAVLKGLEGSLGLWEGEQDFVRAREAIVTWDHGRFALPCPYPSPEARRAGPSG